MKRGENKKCLKPPPSDGNSNRHVLRITSVTKTLNKFHPEIHSGSIFSTKAPNRLNFQDLQVQKAATLPETNIAIENGFLEDYFPFGKAYFPVRHVSSGRVSLFFGSEVRL